MLRVTLTSIFVLLSINAFNTSFCSSDWREPEIFVMVGLKNKVYALRNIMKRLDDGQTGYVTSKSFLAQYISIDRLDKCLDSDSNELDVAKLRVLMVESANEYEDEYVTRSGMRDFLLEWQRNAAVLSTYIIDYLAIKNLLFVCPHGYTEQYVSRAYAIKQMSPKMPEHVKQYLPTDDELKKIQSHHVNEHGTQVLVDLDQDVFFNVAIIIQKAEGMKDAAIKLLKLHESTCADKCQRYGLQVPKTFDERVTLLEKQDWYA